MSSGFIHVVTNVIIPHSLCLFTYQQHCRCFCILAIVNLALLVINVILRLMGLLYPLSGSLISPNLVDRKNFPDTNIQNRLTSCLGVSPSGLSVLPVLNSQLKLPSVESCPKYPQISMISNFFLSKNKLAFLWLRKTSYLISLF
jgi:hypothetical protein